MASELQAICGELLPSVILSVTPPSVPVTSLTLAPFATHGYVRDGDHLKYVEQAAKAITLSGADGNYWLALHVNTSATVASWTRVPGTHYLWRSNPTLPADPVGALVFYQVTLAGGVISAVAPVVAVNGAPMATQVATAINFSGGSGVFTGLLGTTGEVQLGGAGPITAFIPMTVNGLTNGSTTTLNDTVTINVGGLVVFPSTTLSGFTNNGAGFSIYARATQHALTIRPSADSGPGAAILLQNAALGVVGSIVTDATTTAYNTSSDERLKHAIEALSGALAVVQALRPVRFKWNANDSQAEGFIAHELQQVIPQAVTGEPNALNDDGTIRPQQVDHSKLVVWLAGAVQELAARVEALEAQLAP